ncbi:unnamed protein product [Cylindrotheca closterium]|uniref:Uncharacterized protein n=1 Tax=Cylindrotheca closterium TaxID=2856 RepID=A0AAD2FX80_9STRA|nr:unnamed protein product [Cylindrotheca closterium]
MPPNDIPSEAVSGSPYTTRKKSKRYRMVALDLDGTLLSSNGTLADVQAEYLRGLSEKGFILCLATGRSARRTYDHAAKLQIPRLPIVCNNGARGLVWSPGKSEDDPVIADQFQFLVPKGVAQRAIDLANKHGFFLQYYYRDSVYANEKSESHYTCTKKYTERRGIRIQHIEDDYQEMLDKDQLPTKLLLLFDSSVDYDNALQATNDAFGPSEATIVPGSWKWSRFLEILNASNNKGMGLQHMCEQLKVPLDEVIAIGDANNDIEFLQMAGLGVAVKNAVPEVKEIADVTLDFTNDDHGPMRILQELEEKGELDFHHGRR